MGCRFPFCSASILHSVIHLMVRGRLHGSSGGKWCEGADTAEAPNGSNGSMAALRSFVRFVEQRLMACLSLCAGGMASGGTASFQSGL